MEKEELLKLIKREIFILSPPSTAFEKERVRQLKKQEKVLQTQLDKVKEKKQLAQGSDSDSKLSDGTSDDILSKEPVVIGGEEKPNELRKKLPLLPKEQGDDKQIIIDSKVIINDKKDVHKDDISDTQQEKLKSTDSEQFEPTGNRHGDKGQENVLVPGSVETIVSMGEIETELKKESIQLVADAPVAVRSDLTQETGSTIHNEQIGGLLTKTEQRSEETTVRQIDELEERQKPQTFIEEPVEMDNVEKYAGKTIASLAEIEEILDRWEVEERPEGWLANQSALLGAVSDYLQKAQPDDDAVRHEEVKGRFIDWIRPILADSLAQCEDELAELKKIRFSAENFLSVQARANAVHMALKTAGGLRWVLSGAGRALLDKRNEQLKLLHYSLEQWDLFLRESGQIMADLAEAEKLDAEPGGGMAAAALAGDANTAVQTLEERLDTSEDHRLRIEFLKLKQHVGNVYSDLRNRHHIPTTANTVEPLADLIRQWRKMPPETRVTYYANLMVDDIVEMDISAALNVARERYLGAVVKRIDEEYVSKAREYLQEQEKEGQLIRQPDMAKTKLDWQGLPGINEEGILSPDKLRSLKKRYAPLAEEIDKEYRKWSRAGAHIGRARGIKSDKPLAAYREYKNALEDYPYHAALPGLLRDIRKEAAAALERGIREAEEAVQGEMWPTARQKLQTIKELAELEPPSTEQQGKLDRLQKLMNNYVTPLEQTAGQRLNPQEETALLERLQADYDVYWAQWKKYPDRLQQLQARQAVAGLLEEAERLAHKETSVTELKQLREDMKARLELKEPSSQTSANDRKKLQRALAKVEAWLGYAQARDELKKEKELDAFLVDEVDELYVPVVDLTVIQAGIDAAQKDSAASDAVTSAEFPLRLSQLQTKDVKVERLLKQVKTEQMAVTEPDIATLSGWRDKLQDARRTPSSHIREILTLYRDVQTQLRDAAAGRLKTLLGDNLMTHFETTDENGRFNSRANEKLEKEIKDLLDEYGRDRQDSLAQTAIIALAFTRAHRKQAEVTKTNDWPAVKDAWDSARQFDPGELDASSAVDLEDLQQYAENQYRQAWKQTIFADAEYHPDAREAETSLWSLCQDSLLRYDWDVWYRHGRHCLDMAARWLQEADGQQSQQAETYLHKAGSSLSRAERLSASQRVSVGEQTAVANAVSECAGWLRVIALDNEIRKKLLLDENADRPIPSANCQKAVTLYNNSATANLQLEQNQQQALTRIWERRRETALQRLETQYAKIEGPTSLFGQLDNLVARAILYPDNKTITALIRDHFERTLNSLEQDVDPDRGGITFDDSGARFRRYYQQQHNGQPPPDEKIADLQREKADAQQSQAKTLRLALSLTKLDQNLYLHRLNRLEDTLKDWHGKISVGLINPLTEARSKADAGLRAPQYFRTARYILRMSGGERAGGIARIDSRFTDHLTVRWYRAYLEKQEQRRARQQEYFDEINNILSQEPPLVTFVQKARQTQTLLEAGQIAKLEKQAEDFRRVLIQMERMQREEPDDVCSLQSELKYDSADDGCFYRFLDNVREAVNDKVKQYDQATAWTAERRADYEDPHRAVSLNEARQMIDKLSNDSKLGLIAAREFLSVLCGSDGKEKYQGNWADKRQKQAAEDSHRSTKLPLEDAWLPGGIYEDAFTLHGLLNVCRESDLKKHLDAETLLAITEAPNQKRRQLCDDIEQDIQSVEDERESLQKRIERFDDAWERFQQAVNDLYAVSRWRRRNLYQQPEWDALITAKNDFCEICSNYEPFIQALQDLHDELDVRLLDCDDD